MYRKIFSFFAVLCFSSTLLLAQDGKVRGQVTDRETGEALIGATVAIEGTTLGASTDINGSYIILSVPPGVHTLRASYVGYAPVIITNVRVSPTLTTTQDFQLPSSTVQVDPVQIIGERPLVQRNTTNTVRMAIQEDLQVLPARSLQTLVALNAGVVQQDGRLYVRGGRAGEVGYYIEGANVTNPFFNSENVTVIREAIEEFQLQAGGYTAEMGGSNSGLVRTTMRTGGSNYKATVDYSTDDFAKPGKEFLKTSSFGYRNAVVTLGGPIPALKNGRFFLTAQHNYIRNRQTMIIEPFKFELKTDAIDPRGAGKPLPGPIEFSRNYLPASWRFENTGQGTLLYDFDPVKLRLSGSYSYVEQPVGGTWPTALHQYFNQKRRQTSETKTGFANLRMTHVLSPETFYELGISYQNRSARRFDPVFEDNWLLYTDSIANAQKGFPGFAKRYEPPLRYSVVNGFRMAHENSPTASQAGFVSYAKNAQSAIGASFDFTSQVTREWEAKVGGRLDAWRVRNYSVADIQAANEFLYGIRGNTPTLFASPEERRIRLAKQAVINHYGYDVDGNKANDGLDAPKKPIFASVYLQNKFEYRDVVLNLGVRYELMDTKNKEFVDPVNPSFDNVLDVIDESKLKEQDPFQLVLPRISLSFPVTDRTVFYALYGKFAQFPQLNEVYYGNTVVSRTVSPITRGNAFLQPVGFFVKPERLTQYEMGFRQSLTSDLALTISGIYKDYRDQLAVRKFLSPQGAPLYNAFTNQDFGTVKALELTLDLRRTKRLAAKVNYTMSDARGTGTEARSAFGAVEIGQNRYPSFISQLEFNQTHRGNVILDYRFPRGDGGPILEGMGFNLLASFNSGHNYTKIAEPSDLGQANPFNVGVRPLIDPRSRKPAEPLNASSTPAIFNLDLRFSKVFYFGAQTVELYASVLNLLNTQHIINVYPSTGTAQDDGWLRSPLASGFVSIPDYEAFYRAVNLQNRWAYQIATGNDLLDSPRQFRVGLRLEI